LADSLFSPPSWEGWGEQKRRLTPSHPSGSPTKPRASGQPCHPPVGTRLLWGSPARQHSSALLEVDCSVGNSNPLYWVAPGLIREVVKGLGAIGHQSQGLGIRNRCNQWLAFDCLSAEVPNPRSDTKSTTPYPLPGTIHDPQLVGPDLWASGRSDTTRCFSTRLDDSLSRPPLIHHFRFLPKLVELAAPTDQRN